MPYGRWNVADIPLTELKTAASGSWIGRWWSRAPPPSTTPAPVKANLGEESAFVYDKDLKRWVNRKVRLAYRRYADTLSDNRSKQGGADAAKASVPPPPPSRAQTVSPSRSSPQAPNAPPVPTPPPTRPATAFESTGPPPKKAPPRVRSNLVPAEGGSPPLTPDALSSLTAAPPMGRPKSAATKRNIRSRYVDVFQTTGTS